MEVPVALDTPGAPKDSQLRLLTLERLAYHDTISPQKNLALYQYRRLQHEDSIRLLKFTFLHPTRVEYELVERRLADMDGQYVAISYRWGILRPDRFIALRSPENAYLPVTRTIATMLQYIVGDLDVRHVWIDALCINQDDVAEKNRQVAMMSSIFRCAKSVRVWLGRISISESESFVWLWVNLVLRQDIRASMDFERVDRQLRLMLGAEWFERVWVIQEVCLAHEVAFQYGRIVISMEKLHELVQLRLQHPHTPALVDIQQSDGSHDVLIHAFSVLQEFHSIRTFMKHHEEGLRNLSETYASFADQKATDPRDNIYALLGLMNPAFVKGIYPDYSASVNSVYIDATIRMIDAEGRLSILGSAGLTRGTSGFRSTRQLPTWVPDFSASSKADVWSRSKSFRASSAIMTQPIRFSLMPMAHSCMRYNLSNFHFGATILDLFDTSDKMLGSIALETCIFDTVDSIAAWPKTFDSEGARVGDKRNMYETLRETYVFVKAENTDAIRSPGSAENLCWRLLIANLNGEDAADNTIFEDARVFVASLMVMLGITRRELKQEQQSVEFSALWPTEEEFDAATSNIEKGQRNIFAESFARSGAGHSRRVFCTKKGYLGLAADGVAPGDLACLFPGARVPFLIRGPVAAFSSRLADVDRRDYYHVICEAYIHGIMQGELVKSDELQYETIHLV